jgi:hypothetical protein
MPFTSPLLTAVAGLQFDCLIENTNTYPQPSTSSNSFRLSNNASGSWNVIKDTKSITNGTTDHPNGDGVRLNNSGTLTLTLIQNYTVTGSITGDSAGMAVRLTDTTLSSSPPANPINSFDFTTFQHGSTGSITQAPHFGTIQLSLDSGNNALYYGLRRLVSHTGNLQASGRLLIGINKT